MHPDAPRPFDDVPGSGLRVGRMVARLAEQLARDGVAWPTVAAAAIAARGIADRSLEQFADDLGLDTSVLAAIERGGVGPAQVPRPLWRRMRLVAAEVLDDGVG